MRAIGIFLFLALCVPATPGHASLRLADSAVASPRTAAEAPTVRLAQNSRSSGQARKDASQPDGARVSPRSLNGVIKSQPQFRGAKITSVYIRRPARTASGFMYEVWVRSRNGSETIVYVDPDSRRILYEAPGRR